MKKTKCSHVKCRGLVSCLIEDYAFFHEENTNKLYPKNNGCWRNGRYVTESVILKFCGVDLHLDVNGRYRLEDITGG